MCTHCCPQSLSEKPPKMKTFFALLLHFKFNQKKKNYQLACISLLQVTTLKVSAFIWRCSFWFFSLEVCHGVQSQRGGTREDKWKIVIFSLCTFSFKALDAKADDSFFLRNGRFYFLF